MPPGDGLIFSEGPIWLWIVGLVLQTLLLSYIGWVIWRSSSDHRSKAMKVLRKMWRKFRISMLTRKRLELSSEWRALVAKKLKGKANEIHQARLQAIWYRMREIDARIEKITGASDLAD